MKLGIHKKAIALAVLVVVSGSFAHAAGGKTKRGGTTAVDAKTNTKGTSVQSARINKGASATETAAPATGNFRRARTGFGAAQTTTTPPAAAKTAAAPKAVVAPKAERPRVSTTAKSGAAAEASPARDTVAAIQKAGLDSSLNGQLPLLGKMMASDATLLAAASEMVKTASAKPQLHELHAARIESLPYIGKLPSEVRNTETDFNATEQDMSNAQAYVALSQNAALDAVASNWPDVTLKNMTELLTRANTNLAKSNLKLESASSQEVVKAVSNAIESARIEMLNISKVKIDLKQVKERCGSKLKV